MPCTPSAAQSNRAAKADLAVDGEQPVGQLGGDGEPLGAERRDQDRHIDGSDVPVGVHHLHPSALPDDGRTREQTAERGHIVAQI